MNLLRLRFLTCLVVATAGGVAPGFSESQGLIQRQIDGALQQSLWRLGPFRLSPSLRIDGGYDSNGLSSPDFPQDDIRARLGPGLRVVVPVRNRALFDVFEEINLVYYRKLEQRREIYGVTRVGGAFGGKSLLVRCDATRREQKTRPTSEFDIPTDERTSDVDISLSMALGWRHELALSYRNSKVRILDPDAEVGGTPVHKLLDRVEEDYRLHVSRRLTGKTTGVLEGFFEILDFEDEAAERDAQAYGGVAGFDFTGGSNVEGKALLGYKRIIPDVATQADFSGLIGSVDVAMELGERLRLQGLYSRDAVPSVLDNNWFFTESRYGGSLEVSFMRRFSIRPGVVFGHNTYPRPARLINDQGEQVEVEVIDRFETYSLRLNSRVKGPWVVSLIADYFRRDSNFRSFAKDRLVFNFGISAGF